MKSTLLLAFCSLLILGCKSLDPAGPYHGDKVTADADAVIVAAYETLHTFVAWEFDNRAALAGTPEVTKFADSIRAGAQNWIQSAIAVRDAYAASPTAENRTALTRALDSLRAAILQARKYLTTPIPRKI